MRLPEPMGPSLSDCVKNLTLCVPIIVLKCAFQWSAFVSLEKGSENKNACSWLLREESVYKKMSLSLDYFCLRRATVCYSGLIWSCCGFLEFPPHISYSGSFNLFHWWCKEYVKQSCKNMLIMLVSCHDVSWAVLSILYFKFGATVVSKLWLRWVSWLRMQIIQIQNTVRTGLDWCPSFTHPKENVNGIMGWWEATKG